MQFVTDASQHQVVMKPAGMCSAPSRNCTPERGVVAVLLHVNFQVRWHLHCDVSVWVATWSM